MMLNVSKVDTWKASMEDQPGGLAAKLQGLVIAGADLEFVIARRSSSQPGMGVVFITPLVNDHQISAARNLGFAKSQTLHTIRIEGPDEPGAAFMIASDLAAEKLNIRGFSASRQGRNFIAFVAFDNESDADKAMKRFQRAL
jgi:hypothetical protein